MSETNESTTNTSAIWTTWSDEKFNQEMDKARLQGDGHTGGIDADQLMQEVLLEELKSPEGRTTGRLGYNRLLDVADRLADEPELALVSGSQVSKYLDQVPEPARDYFDPGTAPDWIDPEQLKLASSIWDKHMIAMLLGLFSSSLPACYLIKNGIGALYDSRKLSNSKYVGQRLFETSLMLDEVMSLGGVNVVEDSRISFDSASMKALDELIPGAWELNRGKITIDENHEIVRSQDAEAFHRKLEERTREIYQESKPGKYLWGRGFISARKVRALHSSMRFMLQNPQVFGKALGMQEGGCPFSGGSETRFSDEIHRRSQDDTCRWDIEKLGAPINQEDQALTLLTFSYLLPRSIEHWGARLGLEEKNAFLHLWKVVGYVMGVRTELTTDRWDEAEDLYRRILNRQGGESLQGKVLTRAVVQFTAQYLPSFLGTRNVLTSGSTRALKEQIEKDRAAAARETYGTELPESTAADSSTEDDEDDELEPLACFPQNMVIDQMRIDRKIFKDAPGEKDPAVMVLGKAEVADCSGFLPSIFYFIFRIGMKIYFIGTDWILKPFPILQNFVSKLVRETGIELYKSFKGEYLRKPFYIPSDATQWVLEPGVTQEFRAKLRKWRRGLFVRMVLGLAAAFGFTLFAVLFAFTLAYKCLILFKDGVDGKLMKEMTDAWELLDMGKDSFGLGFGYSLWQTLLTTGILAAAMLITSTILLRWVAPRYFKKRPRLQSELLEQ